MIPKLATRGTVLGYFEILTIGERLSCKVTLDFWATEGARDERQLLEQATNIMLKK